MGAVATCAAGTVPTTIFCDSAKVCGSDELEYPRPRDNEWATMEVANFKGLNGERIDPWSRMAKETTWNCGGDDAVDEGYIADSALGGSVWQEKGGHFALLDDSETVIPGSGPASAQGMQLRWQEPRKAKETPTQVTPVSARHCLGPPMEDTSVVFVTKDERFVV
mmetsp:Transcript_79228/g.232644  ORF Transcript_79228/g.232644 Transcript_79228/m.232644 type:complete len:165 (+) Transcript_79228:87-581(+)